MENQVNQTETQAMLNRIIFVLMEEVNKMVDARVERIMATQASAAVFDDSLEARIRNIAMEEVGEKIDELEDALDDKVNTAVNELDIDESVARAFQHRVNWEEQVREFVDDELDDKIDTEVDNKLEDAIEVKLDEMLEEKVREVLINIIKGECDENQNQ